MYSAYVAEDRFQDENAFVRWRNVRGVCTSAGDGSPRSAPFALDLTLWRPAMPEDCEKEDEPDEYDCGRVFVTIGVGRRGYLAS
jgi:hypothetical protein